MTTLLAGFDGATALICVLIVLARVGDVSLGTLRTVMVIHGRRLLASVLGFAEIIVWLSAVGQVITNLDQPVFMIAYALGFALGNWAGLTLERLLALGDEVLFVFSRRGAEVAARLRARQFGVSEFDGFGRDGPIRMLIVTTTRRKLRQAVALAVEADPESFYLVGGVRLASTAMGRLHQASGWRGALKRK